MIAARTMFLLLAACGGGGKDTPTDDAPPPPPGDGPIDTPPLAACASPSPGSTIHIVDTGVNAAALGGRPMLVTAPTGDMRRFVVVQGGTIRIIKDDVLVAAPFLDLSDTVAVAEESGLLGLAFHPQYAANGAFFVYYRRLQGGDNTNGSRNVVARCARSAGDPDKADPTCTEILIIPDFASNHNGGMIEFGADGFLYIGTGDGGLGGDPNNNGQALVDVPATNTVALLGKLLRIDVDNPANGKEYGIPADNPFAAGGGAPEIYAYGLRNPWRFSFDSATGDLWIGDVGQGPNPAGIEEIDHVTTAQLKGANFGWSMFHGSQCFKAPCDTTGKTFAKDERPAGDGWRAIIGGQVYRGGCYPDIVGTYFYGDNRGNKYAKATLNGDGTLTVADLTPPAGESFPPGVASIHADATGELWVTTATGGGGGIFHIEATP